MPARTGSPAPGSSPTPIASSSGGEKTRLRRTSPRTSCTSTTMRRFLDTSTLVWLYDTSDSRKRDAARAVVAGGDSLVVSTNVLGELFVALTKKRAARPPLATVAQAAERVQLAAESLEVASVHREDVLRALG